MRTVDHVIVGGDCLCEPWWDKLDGELIDCLACGPLSAAELGEQLGLSEETAVSLVTMLARDGKVRIHQVALA